MELIFFLVLHMLHRRESWPWPSSRVSPLTLLSLIDAAHKPAQDRPLKQNTVALLTRMPEITMQVQQWAPPHVPRTVRPHTAAQIAIGLNRLCLGVYILRRKASTASETRRASLRQDDQFCQHVAVITTIIQINEYNKPCQCYTPNSKTGVRYQSHSVELLILRHHIRQSA
jgi:hypothetical protein